MSQVETGVLIDVARDPRAQLGRDCRCYLDEKYYRSNPVELLDLADLRAKSVNLVIDDNVVTVDNATTDEDNANVSINDNFKEWIEHHPSGHLTKDKTMRWLRSNSMWMNTQRTMRNFR